MKTKDKLQLLLKMTEHPKNYSAEEWKVVEQDKESREYYELMAESRQAFAKHKVKSSKFNVDEGVATV